MKKLMGIVATISAISLPTTATAGNVNGKSVVDAAATLGSTETFAAAEQALMLTDNIKSDSLFTSPTPIDERLTALTNGAVQELNKPENSEQFFGLVRFHTLDSEIMLQDFLRSLPRATNLTNTTLLGNGELAIEVGIDASYDGIQPADKAKRFDNWNG